MREVADKGDDVRLGVGDARVLLCREEGRETARDLWVELPASALDGVVALLDDLARQRERRGQLRDLDALRRRCARPREGA